MLDLLDVRAAAQAFAPSSPKVSMFQEGSAIVLWYNSERSSRGAEFWMAVKVRNDVNDSPTSFAERVTLIGDKIESDCDRGR